MAVTRASASTCARTFLSESAPCSQLSPSGGSFALQTKLAKMPWKHRGPPCVWGPQDPHRPAAGVLQWPCSPVHDLLAGGVLRGPLPSPGPPAGPAPAMVKSAEMLSRLAFAWSLEWATLWCLHPGNQVMLQRRAFSSLSSSFLFEELLVKYLATHHR